MRRASLLALVVLLAGCSPTRIPPLPEQFDTVVLTSDLAATELYADALAAFVRNNWEPVTGGDTGGDLATRILPDGERVDGTRTPRVVQVIVVPTDPTSAPSDLIPPLTVGSAVLTATVDPSLPGARDVLTRTARILASVQGDLSYR